MRARLQLAIEHEITAVLPGTTGRNDTETNKPQPTCKAIKEAGQTVSQSLCWALIRAILEVDHVWNEMSTCRTKIKIQWILGHSDMAGNGRADEAADLVGTAAQSTFRATVSAIRALLKDGPSADPGKSTANSRWTGKICNSRPGKTKHC